MAETLEARLSELATRAGEIAVLDEAAHRRRRGDRRTRRRRGQAALGIAVAATAVTVSLTVPGTGSASRAATAGAAAVMPSSLASAAASHENQIQGQLRTAQRLNVGNSTYAVISKANPHAISTTFYATAQSTTEVKDFGATWAEVVATALEQGFTHVTIKTEADKAVPADTVIDVQTATGTSVLGQRIPLTTPIVLIAAI